MSETNPSMRALPAKARIALVAPASPARPENIDAAINLLRNWGFDPVEMPHLRDIHPHLPYLAGTDMNRASDVMTAFTDASIDAVMCVRGGYGSARILPFLDVNALLTAGPKPFYGSSDITALHDWLFEHTGRCSWFSPMPATTAVLEDSAAAAMLHDVMTGHMPSSIESCELLHDGHSATVQGRLRGGNLSLMAADTSAIITSTQPKFREPTILLIEDVHEKPYHIDEMLRQLVAANYFSNVAGIMLGSWLGCDDADVPHKSGNRNPGSGLPNMTHLPTPRIIRSIVDDVLGPLGIPIASGFDFGHGPAAHTIPIGARATLSIQPDGAQAHFTIGQ